MPSLLNRFQKFIKKTRIEMTSASPQSLAAVTGRVDDSARWSGLLSERLQDYPASQMLEIYQDALSAWRKNPIAWRIISITTDYTVGSGITITSPIRALNRFILAFWNHPQNRMSLRLEGMSDELARAGDLFVLLFRNPQDGMSYIRFVTKDRIIKIETSPNDWELELAYHEAQDLNDPKVWYSPHHPQAGDAPAIMLHYAVNKPLGALLGELDITTMIPWLQRYSRMLEDRVRLHWSLRLFLWFVTVPSNLVAAKREQYRLPPESGSIIVKDESEKWQVEAPNIQAGDARYDLQAVRQMIDAGAGYPSHWRGEAGDANLATAQAMQAPTERHLLRRQQYFVFILQDILYHAFIRSGISGEAAVRLPQSHHYAALFKTVTADLSRSDHQAQARAMRDMTSAFHNLAGMLPERSTTFLQYVLNAVAHTSGQALDEEQIRKIIEESTKT